MNTLYFVSFIVNFLTNVANSHVLVHFHSSVDLNKSYGLFEFDTVAKQSMHNCVEACKLVPVCRHINFHVRLNLCHLIEEMWANSSVVIATDSVEFVYGSKAEWNMTDHAICSDVCNEPYLACEQSLYWPLCTQTGCGPPPTVLNANVQGNLYTVGSKVWYTCHEDYTISGDPKLHCDASGNWSGSVTCTENPVDGGFSIWSDWTTCSVTCADGSQTRARTCTNPVPAFGGLDCVGNTMATQTCNINGPCPVQCAYEAMYTAGYDGFESFKYTFLDRTVSMFTAQQECQTYCGNLIEIVTYSKLDYMKAIITSDNALDDNDYWIDGENLVDGIWETVSGGEIPLTSTLWSSNMESLQSLSSERCVRLHKSTGYKMNAKDCTASFRFICEKDRLVYNTMDGFR